MDALRAKLAETEQRAAASQARERALLEKARAVQSAWMTDESGHGITDAMDALVPLLDDATPTDDSALRGLCRKVAVRAINAGPPQHVYVDDTDASALARAADAAVCGELGWLTYADTRVLGPEPPSAAEPAGKEEA